ncbi:MAG: hypothetical protein MUF72_13935 [Elainella sp. Prado103]|jgi:hypothetical protein|nr:hypothetical protein [Elainella sp. Prado103]
MHSRIHLGLATFSVIAFAGFATPAMAQSGSTPITDEFGFTGTSPNAAAWLEAINEQYGLITETPITDAQSEDVPLWAEAIREEYGIPSPDVQSVGTPVTDEFGADGSSPDSAAWYERMKEEYGIGTGV